MYVYTYIYIYIYIYIHTYSPLSCVGGPAWQSATQVCGSPGFPGRSETINTNSYYY